MCICAHLQLCDCAQIVSVAAFVALSNDGMRMLQERCYSDIWALNICTVAHMPLCTVAGVHSLIRRRQARLATPGIARQ